MATYFIAAGGTGGHIYPGVALAEALCKVQPEAKIYFIGTPQGLENKIVGQAGYPLLHLNIGRLNSNVSRFERIKTVLQLPLSFFKSLRLLLKYKPSAVIGVGGHASGPIVLTASMIGVPSVIWEPNAFPGMANRILARFVSLACVVFEEAKLRMRASRFVQIGLPLRAEIEELAKTSKEISVRPLKVLVFGGSQGARGINRVVIEFLKANPSWLETRELLHQTGSHDHEDVKSGYGELLKHPHLQVTAYIDDMASAYRWADVMVARAGTGTLAEAAATATPSVLIPLPTAADNHQQKNAEAFVHENAAIMILQKDLTPPLFGETLRRLETDLELRKQLSTRSRAFFQAQAASKMAEEVIRLTKE